MEEQGTEYGGRRRMSGSGIAITAIIAAAVVALGCTVAFTVVAWLFIENAPW